MAASYQNAEEGISLLNVHGNDKNYNDNNNQEYYFHRQITKSFIGSTCYHSDEYYAEPASALGPLVSGGTVNSYRKSPEVKSVPVIAAYQRMARNRSIGLKYIIDFRHWWKMSRLLVRLSGLYVFTQDELIWARLTGLEILRKRGIDRGAKLVKRLGQGGPMRHFLNDVQPFTRTVRIVVATWRWCEATRWRRSEVGVEEFMAFVCNRIFRILSRKIVDGVASYIVLPIAYELVAEKYVGKFEWHSEIILIILGVMRALAPFAASFQGSRFGRVLTRNAFHVAGDRWRPLMRINEMNLKSDDCCECDEVSLTSHNRDGELLGLAMQVAVALGKPEPGRKVGTFLRPEDLTFQPNKHLEEMGFRHIGCGAGGYILYQYRFKGLSILLHITPYGPSIYDELPLYIVLESEDCQDRRASWWPTISRLFYDGPNVLEGYCFKGAYFSSYQFAAMRGRYEKELQSYSEACKRMCTTKGSSADTPPTDLLSLKAFLDLGRPVKKHRRHVEQMKDLDRIVDTIAAKIEKMKNRGTHHHKKDMHDRGSVCEGGDQCEAPPGVILYFEGLDCAGKSSTGTLIQHALERAGYEVKMCRYNRPPTAEQRKRPWMDRFERPDTIVSNCQSDEYNVVNTGYQSTADHQRLNKPTSGHRHVAHVWDRGPAGDFVYGNLWELSDTDKEARYREFLDFDAKCFADGILFCKLLFVTDRDTIAQTLGKRLAHKKICADLRVWENANAEALGGSADEADDVGHASGLDEIDMHIDPTDFVAFNSYHRNLNLFVDFAKNTDHQRDDSRNSFENPWMVVSTSDRYPARLQLLSTFRQKLEQFAAGKRGIRYGWFCGAESLLPRCMSSRLFRVQILTIIYVLCMILLVLLFLHLSKRLILFGDF